MAAQEKALTDASHETLKDEKATDEKLSLIAESMINVDAGDGEKHKDEQEGGEDQQANSNAMSRRKP